jgi:4-amino-4-deoxy-L-arabinose transferase-like glycosyltransferase
MSPSQDSAAPSPCSARWATLAVVVYLALFALLVQRPTFHGLRYPDPAKYADMARNFLQGEGLVTNIVTPRVLVGRQRTERLDAAQIRPGEVRYLGYPLVLAAAFRLFGANDRTVFAAASICWALAGFLVYLLGRRLFSTGVGLTATVLYSLQAKSSVLALIGAADPLCMVLALGIGALILARRRTAAAALIAGALTAFSLVVRQQMFFVAPVSLAGFAALREDRRARTLAWAGLALAVVWLSRGPIVTALYPPPPPPPGEPAPAAAAPPAANELSVIERLFDRVFGVGTLIFSPRFPGHSLQRSLDNPYAGETSLTDEMAAKAKYNAVLLAKTLAWQSGAPLWTAAFVIAAALTWRDRRARRLTLLTTALIGLTAAIGMALFIMARYFQLFIPLMALTVARGLDRLTREAAFASPRVRRGLAGAAALAISFPLPFAQFTSLLPTDPDLAELNVDLRREVRAIAELARANVPADGVVFTDLPWVTAWWADRASIWLPLEPRDVHELSRWVEADYLLLTLEEPEGFAEWRAWLMAKQQGRLRGPDELADWSFVAGARPGGRAIYLFRRGADSPPPAGGS